MQWFKTPTSIMDADVDNEILGAWIRVCAWMATHEVSDDRMPEKPPRSWPLSADEHCALMASPLVIDGHLHCSPIKDIQSITRQREAGRAGGAKGGRPPKAQPKSEHETPRVIATETPGVMEAETPIKNPEKIREDKRRADERTNVQPSEDLFSDDDQDDGVRSSVAIPSGDYSAEPTFAEWKNEHPGIWVDRESASREDWTALYRQICDYRRSGRFKAKGPRVMTILYDIAAAQSEKGRVFLSDMLDLWEANKDEEED